jgi:hypothetical protein
MANKKITELDPITDFLGTEVSEFVQEGINKQGAVHQLRDYILSFVTQLVKIDIVALDTSAGIDIDMDGDSERWFVGSQAINGDRNWSFSNIANARSFIAFVEYDGSYEQTFDPSVIIPGQYRVPGFPNKWLSYPGKFKFKADFDGVNWWMEIHGDY